MMKKTGADRIRRTRELIESAASATRETWEDNFISAMSGLGRPVTRIGQVDGASRFRTKDGKEFLLHCEQRDVMGLGSVHLGSQTKRSFTAITTTGRVLPAEFTEAECMADPIRTSERIARSVIELLDGGPETVRESLFGSWFKKPEPPPPPPPPPPIPRVLSYEEEREARKAKLRKFTTEESAMAYLKSVRIQPKDPPRQPSFAHKYAKALTKGNTDLLTIMPNRKRLVKELREWAKDLEHNNFHEESLWICLYADAIEGKPITEKHAYDYRPEGFDTLDFNQWIEA